MSHNLNYDQQASMWAESFPTILSLIHSTLEPVNLFLVLEHSRHLFCLFSLPGMVLLKITTSLTPSLPWIFAQVELPIKGATLAFLKVSTCCPNPTVPLHHLTLLSFLLLGISYHTISFICLLILFFWSLAPCFMWAGIFILFTDISWTITTAQSSGIKKNNSRVNVKKKKSMSAWPECGLWLERRGMAFAGWQREHLGNTHACALKGGSIRKSTSHNFT